MNDIDEARDKISFGRERRKLMDDEDRKIIAFHEAGHALIKGVLDDGHMPVHKVTIIPRGQSLGSTMFMPKKDTLNHSKRRLIDDICCTLGGRAAEEIVLGDITSGASGDIQMASRTARHMVCDWGMSELGMVALGQSQSGGYLGHGAVTAKNYSEETAQKIDVIIRDMIQDQYSRALEILNDKRNALDVIAESLLEHETIDGKHVLEIIEHGEMRSPIVKREIPVEELEEDEEEGEVPKKPAKEDGDNDGLAGEEAPALA
jgi:cell division protease FtsH